MHPAQIARVTIRVKIYNMQVFIWGNVGRANILFFTNVFRYVFYEGYSHILATEKSYVYRMVSTHSHAPGDFAFGSSPALWRPQNAIDPIVPEFTSPSTKGSVYKKIIWMQQLFTSYVGSSIKSWWLK